MAKTPKPLSNDEGYEVLAALVQRHIDADQRDEVMEWLDFASGCRSAINDHLKDHSDGRGKFRSDLRLLLS